MEVQGKLLKEVAEAIASSYEERGNVQVDVKGGYLEVKFEKGAHCWVEPDTGYCNVSEAWCNVINIDFIDEDNEETSRVDCDLEKLESLTAEYMNN